MSVSKIKFFESYELGFFFNRNGLEEIFKMFIDWGYLSKIISISENPYKPSQYPSKFENLDLDLDDMEFNSWVLDYDFQFTVIPVLRESFFDQIEKKCEEYNLKFFFERMPSGRYIFTVIQFFPKFIQEFCDKICKFGETGISLIYKNVRFFVKLTCDQSQKILLEVYFTSVSPRTRTDITIFSKFLENKISEILGYQFEIEYLNKSKDNRLGEYLIYNIPY